MDKYHYSLLNKKITQLATCIRDLFFNPIYINACLHYSFGKVVHRNWGDDINIFLLEVLFRKKISPLYFSSIAMRFNKKNYLIIGSTITMLTNKNTIIWGAGVIDDKANLPAKPLKVLAVRGPLSRKYLLKKGIECPEIYGDPAMLMKYIYKPILLKNKYKLGIIPHYDDYDSPLLDIFKNNPDILFIKMEGYRKWTDIIDQIVNCEYIISSSLHGLIMAETYNIPNLWIEISGKLLGGHFKFHDFFQSIGHDRQAPFYIKGKNIKQILATRSDYVKGHINLNPLINSSPFKLYLSQEYNEL